MLPTMVAAVGVGLWSAQGVVGIKMANTVKTMDRNLLFMMGIDELP
jgi:hypothetical protein